MRITAMLTIQTKYTASRPTPTQASAELERLAIKMCDIGHSSSPCSYIEFLGSLLNTREKVKTLFILGPLCTLSLAQRM